MHQQSLRSDRRSASVNVMAGRVSSIGQVGVQHHKRMEQA